MINYYLAQKKHLNQSTTLSILKQSSRYIIFS